MSTKLAVGDKLTMEADGMTGEMIVTAIEPNAIALFGEGDTVRVKETLTLDGEIIREYDTYFDANKLVDGKLFYNGWSWRKQ